MGFMIVEQGYKYNRSGYPYGIPCGVVQFEGTNSYERLSDAKQKVKAILANKDWGYEEGELMIVKFEQV